jgi:hypothetical protein
MRLLLPHVLALEVWNLPVAGNPLQAWRADPAFPHHLAAAIQALRTEPPAAKPTPMAWRDPGPHTGRIASATGRIASATERVTHDLVPIRDDTAHARVRAPIREDTERGPSDAASDARGASDLVPMRDDTARVVRDLVLAPLRDDTAPADFEAARASTIRFLGGVLAEPRAARIVLGLPCELDAAGVPRTCSYCFRDPDPELVPALARLANAAITVVNDAALAALAAARDPAVPRTRTALVLTLGFGVGAAVLLPQP